MATLTVTDIVVSEADGFAEFIVRLDGTAPGVVTVQYQNTNYSAIHNKDYRYVDGTLTFAPGETTKTVRLELIDDTTAEPPEHFMLELRNPTNATLARAHAAAYVVDNDTIVDTPQVYVRDVVVDEKAGTATFEVRLGHYYGQSAGAAVSVQYATRDAGAVAGQDYSALSGTLTFAPGESVKTVVVDLLDDSVAEALERFELVLSHPVGVTIGDGVAMARIGPSDGTLAAAPRLSVADITVGEADGYAEFVVTMHAPSSNVVTVQYQNTNYSAIHNKDYRYVDGTLTFAPGETTKTVRLELIDDTTAEPPEHFMLELRNPTNATLARAHAAAYVVDNDTIVDTPQVYVRDVVVDEKAGTATISVRLGDFQGQAAGATATVQYTTRDATAIAGQDYTAISGTLVFAPGESVKTVVVDLQDDALREPLERFDFVLSQPVGLLLADGIAVIEIGASDGTPAAQPRLSVTDVTVSEAAGYADFVVSLHAPSSSLVTVNYANVNGSATNNADYRYVDGTLTFAPGETTKTVRVELIDNLATETTETFDLTLRSATAATLADAQATATVIDNDDTELMPLGYGRSNDIYDLPATAVTFIEAPDGGLDIVRSSISYTAPAHIEGVFLSGSAASATGNELANVLRGTAGNNTLSGLGGIDTAVFLATSGQATRSGTIDTATVSTPLDGTDTLLSIERLRFADVILASDTMPGGNTYLAYAMFNAGFNRGPDAAELGQWTAQLDMLGKGGDLAQAMINYYAPGVPNDVLVAHLWSTVVGTPIGSEELATYVGLIENGTYTQASLLELVATLELNTAEITGIVGQAVALDLSSFPLAG